MFVLGIESTCDETGVALVSNGSILSEALASQIDIHREFSGVVPELASREHLKRLNILIEEVLQEADCGFEDLEAVAVSSKPGLEGSILVGLTAARTLSYLKKIRLVELDHINAHIFSGLLTEYPMCGKGLALVVSGGHTRLAEVDHWEQVRVLGNTKDDALGECFDKIASVLALPYPGGPSIEKEALNGDRERFSFSVYNSDKDYDFSYSGLKTSVLNTIRKEFSDRIDDNTLADLAASFQETAFKPLLDKSFYAAKKYELDWIFVCGGVAANSRLRELFKEESIRRGVRVYFPEKALCTDNASMVAVYGEHLILKECG
jgi:N6-L-threonylcarbamoyladenine synthase